MIVQYAGQVCVSPMRLLIEDNTHADFVDRFTAIAKGLRIGDGLDPAPDMDPLANGRRIPHALGLALPEVPFGGGRESGYGTEGGSEAPVACFATRFVSHKA